MPEEDELGVDVVEEVTSAVADDGTTVVEDVIAAVDEETGDAVVDDIVAVAAPDGSMAAEEVITAISGEDGSEEVLSDTITSIDTDGNVEIDEVVGE